MKNITVPLRLEVPTPCAERCENLIEVFQNGNEYRWTQYLPSSLKSGLPLVVEIHGGGGNGERQSRVTAWAELAERENFVVIYPSANNIARDNNIKNWRCQQDNFLDDADYLYDIIMFICGKYEIDKERIYISGMSFGDMMSSIFAAKYGGMLAGLCSFNGPTAPWEWHKLKLTSELPVIQIRGELDLSLPFPEQNKLTEEEAFNQKKEFYILNRENWMAKLETSKIPQITLKEKINFALYEGRTSDLLYVECKSMGHVEPEFGMDLAWRYCFSRFRRTAEGIERINDLAQVKTGNGTFVIASGVDKIYSSNGIRRIASAPVMGIPEALPKDNWCIVSRNDYKKESVLYIKLEQLAEIISSELTDNRLNFNDTVYTFYPDNYLVATDKEHFSMSRPALLIDNVVWVPAGDALEVMGFKYSENDGVLYCSDMCSYLTHGFATLLRRMFEQTP